jgi:hypothetical protein
MRQARGVDRVCSVPRGQPAEPRPEQRWSAGQVCGSLGRGMPNAQRPHNPAPRWLVTNGRAVIGPVTSRALLRAIERGMVGPDCLVRQPSWAAWRAPSQVREVASWLRGPRETPQDAEPWLDRATDAGELAHWALVAATRATGACVGLAHLERGRGYSTCCALGPGAESALGQTVLPGDSAASLARRGGGAVLGDLQRGAPEVVAAAQRLGWLEGLSGVALLPLRGERRLLGWLEVGRTGHPFRRADRLVLERIAWGVRIRSS